jgi:type III restriction/modification enzyme restriction subunit
MELRDYQIDISEKAAAILLNKMIVYLAMQVRTGKTATALNTAKLNVYKKVIFLTKLKAISSIEKDYKEFGFDKHFSLTVINNQSLHKVLDNDFDCCIMDEAHRLGSFPKPSQMAKDLKERFGKLPIIFLSGTPYPESYSQIFHQFWCSNYSPFTGAFYSWFNKNGFVKVSFDRGFGEVNDYSNSDVAINKYYDFQLRFVSKDYPEKESKKSNINLERANDLERMKLANDKLMAWIEPYFLRYTQSEAGFTSTVNEHILYCDMSPITNNIISKLTKDKVVQGKGEVILGDTPVKLMTKIHQLSSGTIKFESGNTQTIDTSKADFIKTKFNGKKIGIFYKFKEEYNLLQSVYGDNICNDLEEFNSTNKNIALQIVAGREGISLKNADCLVYFTIDFSALSYWQSRDRLTTIDRLSNDVYWIFSKGGIEKRIYNAVVKKKNYTASVFMKQYGI